MKRKSGSTSAMGPGGGHGGRLETSASASRANEQRLESLDPAPLLELQHPLGMLGVGQRTEGEQHDGQAGAAQAWRDYVKICWIT